MIKRVLNPVLTGLALLVSAPAFADTLLSLPPQQKVQADDFSGYPYNLRIDGAKLTLAGPGEVPIPAKDKSHPEFYFLDLSGEGTKKDGLFRKGPFIGPYSSGTALTLTLMQDIKKGETTFYIPVKTFGIKKPAKYEGDDVSDATSLIREAREFRASKDYETAVENSKSIYLTIVNGKIINGTSQ